MLPGAGLKSSTFVCVASEAQSTMPFDINPIIFKENIPANFLGFKFANTNTYPVIYSIGIKVYNPDAIYLTSFSPISISSQYNLSDSGC